MEWTAMYGKDRQPTLEAISEYVDSPYWQTLQTWLQTSYGVQPQMTYSGCSGQPGWNLKFKKGGRALCTLYPMEGWFIALVVIGAKEEMAYSLRAPGLTPYVQSLYDASAGMPGQKWLMIPVRGADALEDVKALVEIRRPAQ